MGQDRRERAGRKFLYIGRKAAGRAQRGGLTRSGEAKPEEAGHRQLFYKKNTTNSFTDSIFKS